MLGKPRSEKAALRLEGLEARDVPTVIANADQYQAVAGQVLTVSVGQGVLNNDFSDAFVNGTSPQLSASLTSTVRYVQPPGTTAILPPLPSFGGQNSVVLNGDGSFRFIAPSADQIPAGVSQVTFNYTARNLNNAAEVQGVAQVTIDLALSTQKLIAVGPEAGFAPVVKAYNAGDGSLITYLQSLQPYESSFTGGVRVAVGDVTGDGVDDIATVPASGGSARLVVYNGRTGERILDQIAFDPTFRGGAYVAIGDFNGDGRADIAIGSGEGGGPRVQTLQYNRPAPVPGTGAFGTLTLLGDYFVFESTVRNGVRVAAGDLRGEGRDLLVVSPGVGGGPRVRVVDPQATGTTNTAANGRPVPAGQVAVSVLDFFAADQSNRDGVYIATGNVRGDGKFDIITGSGSGSALVQIFDGRTGGLVRQFAPPASDVPTGSFQSGVSTVTGLQTGGSGTLLNSSQNPGSLVPGGVAGAAGSNPFFRNTTGGARVAATDYNGDGLDDIVVGNGPGNQSRVRVYDTRTQALLTSIQPYESSFLGGINVAAS